MPDDETFGVKFVTICPFTLDDGRVSWTPMIGFPTRDEAEECVRREREIFRAPQADKIEIFEGSLRDATIECKRRDEARAKTRA